MPRPPAKLTRPHLRRPFLRERLFNWLDQARAAFPAVAIVGTPGAGKTTLVASWLETRKIGGIWYRVDQDDADAATFFHYLGQAVQSARRTREVPLSRFTAEYRQDLAGYSRRYFRTLFSRLPPNSALVLDNFQDAGEGSPLPEAIAAAVSEVPSGTTLILVTRHDLPQAFSRHFASSALCSLAPDDMALDDTEARAIALQHGSLREEDLARLVELSGGWAAGLTLLLQGARPRGFDAGPIVVGRPDETFGFFADQVLGQLEPDEQKILFEIACLPHVTERMATELTQSDRAPALLRHLFRRHLFFHRSRGAGDPFECHALFREFLWRRAAEVLPPSEWRTARIHAARVCRSNGLVDDAMTLLLAAQDWTAATELFGDCVETMLRQGRFDQLRHWVDGFPQSWVRDSAVLEYGRGSACAGDDPMAAMHSLQVANGLFERDGDRIGMARTASALIEVIFHATSDHRAMLPWIDFLDTFVTSPAIETDPDLDLRANAALLIARLFAAPKNPALADTADRIFARLSSAGSAERRLTATIFLTIYATFTGRFELAPSLVAHGDELSQHTSTTPHALASWLLWKSYACRLLGHYEAARDAAVHASAIAEAERFGPIRFLAAYFRSGTESVFGNLEEASRQERKAAGFADPSRQLQRALLAACSAWIALYRADAPAARLHGEHAMSVARSLAAPSYRIHYGIPLVYGLVETGCPDQALAVVAEQRAAVAGTAINGFEPLFLAAEARIAELQGDLTSARDRVRALWARAVDHDHGRYLSWVKPWMPRFCEWGLEDGTFSPYIHAFIRSYHLRPPGGCSDQWPWGVRIYCLGGFRVLVGNSDLQFGRKTPRRPLELLRALVARGGDGVPEDEIADHLWPDDEADAAHRSLSAALHRLRSLLGHPDAVTLRGGVLALNSDHVWTDVAHFRRTADSLQRTLVDRETEVLAARALDIYRGSFLPEDRGDTWVLATREQLRARYLAIIEESALQSERLGDHDRAVELFTRGVEADQLRETLHQGLIRNLTRAGRMDEAQAALARLSRTLSSAFGRTPSAASRALVESRKDLSR